MLLAVVVVFFFLRVIHAVLLYVEAEQGFAFGKNGSILRLTLALHRINCVIILLPKNIP